ncbi:olfactory receptor 11A1-like [Genypterus blacodes]|uniref:olfactory receptor 11A1-like n=1 Tax=Genypterus blacodes TaxID=154954 RepID=UPI003F765BBC
MEITGNYTQFSYFILSAYLDTGLLKYLYFMVVMVVFILICCTNVLLIVVICVNRSLHEPLYLFLCSLFVNELFGSTGLFPFLLVQILSDIHTVSVLFCFIQVFWVYSYATIELLTLTIMAYDRYLAICCPLQYNTQMTPNKITMLIVMMWLLPFLVCLIPISLSIPLKLCENFIHEVYCNNYNIVKLACSDTTANNIYDLFGATVVLFGPVALILFSYMKILKVCFSGSKQTRQKAVSTCTPHLASLLNFCFGCFFETLQIRFDMTHVPIILRIFLSLYFLTCQPLFNPVLYGLNMTKIRILCKSMLFHKT